MKYAMGINQDTGRVEVVTYDVDTPFPEGVKVLFGSLTAISIKEDGIYIAHSDSSIVADIAYNYAHDPDYVNCLNHYKKFSKNEVEISTDALKTMLMEHNSYLHDVDKEVVIEYTMDEDTEQGKVTYHSIVYVVTDGTLEAWVEALCDDLKVSKLTWDDDNYYLDGKPVGELFPKKLNKVTLDIIRDKVAEVLGM